MIGEGSRHVLELSSHSAEYALLAPTWRSIKTLHTGYTEIVKNIERFLPRRPSEDEDLYQLRVKKLGYTPLLSSVVSRYRSRLVASSINFQSEINAKLEDFRDNNSKHGKRSEKGLIADIFKHLLLYACCWVVVDAEKPSIEPRTAYEESLEPRKVYTTLLDPLEVISWGVGWHITQKFIYENRPFEVNRLEVEWRYHDRFVTLVYRAPVEVVSEHDIEGNLYNQITHIYREGVKISVKDDKCKIDPVTTIRKGGVYNVVHLDISDTGWLCRDLYPKQIEHLQIESAWLDAGYLAGTIQRLYTPADRERNDDPRAPLSEPDYQTELAKAGNAHILVGKSYQFVESQGSATANQSAMLDKIEHQIDAIAAMHFASGSNKVRSQSGLSKSLDMDLLDNSLKEYGERVLDVYNAVLSLACSFMGIAPITADGLQDFDRVDTLELMAVIELLKAAPEISPQLLKQLYLKLLETVKIDIDASLK